MSSKYAPYSESTIEEYAIALYNQAVLEGREVRPPSEETKEKYRDAAFNMMVLIKERNAVTNRGNFIVVGSTPPTRVIEPYEPAYYDHYPALDPTK
jgi:hypothetical protein